MSSSTLLLIALFIAALFTPIHHHNTTAHLVAEAYEALHGAASQRRFGSLSHH